MDKLKYQIRTIGIIALAVVILQSYPVWAAPGDCAPGDIKKDGACLYGSNIVPGEFGTPISDPRANIRLAINVVMSFLGVVVVAMIIYGGFFWITAAGAEEKVTKGKQTIMWAAIGGIAVSIAWTIASYILQAGRVIGGSGGR